MMTSQLFVLLPLPEYPHASESLPLHAGPHLVAGHELLLVHHLLVAEEEGGQQLVVSWQIQIQLDNSVHALEKTVPPFVVTAERHPCSQMCLQKKMRVMFVWVARVQCVRLGFHSAMFPDQCSELD